MKHYIFYLLLFISLTIRGQQRIYQLPAGIGSENYDPSIIIIRLKTGSTSAARGQNQIQSLKVLIEKSELSVKSITPAIATAIKSGTSARSGANHPLSQIYKVRLAEKEKVLDVINRLLQYDEVAYAEPYFNYRPLYSPNDPESDINTGKQNYLNVIKAFDAWSIERGDTSVVIGILDTGVDLKHDDLIENIKYNYDDPINGIDDDNDGLIDNFSGWDIANNDNMPSSDTDIHGNLVSGVAAASTNNGVGIAGTGFNSKFLPIKVFQSGSNMIYGGYEAIALAADLGCEVINLSWGAPGAWSQFGQDIVDYAVLEKDVAIVAAAGNTNAELDFFPASLNNVISVGASTLGDEKTSFGTFSYHIDILAPGSSIYTATNDNNYGYASGTSLSAPLVAGALALVRARFPSLSAQQAMEKIRVSSDNIYNLAGNKNYEGRLGKGRLNMLKALTESSPAIRMINISHDNGLGPYIFYADTVSITVALKNYLTTSPASTKVRLSCKSGYVSIIDSIFNIGSLATLNSISNDTAPFRLIMSKDLPPNEKLIFRLDFEGGAYKDFQYFELMSSPDYLTIKSRNSGLTISSNGNLGYHRNNFSFGTGFTFKNQKILDNMGLAIATSKDQVIDNFPNILSINQRDTDFSAKENIRLYRNSIASVDERHVFTGPGPAGLRIEQKTLAWSDTDFMILEYRIVNIGDSALSGLQLGLFADWDLNDKNFNSALWNEANQLGYIKDNISDSLYAGVALLKGSTPLYYAIDNKNFNGNTADIPPVINDSIKYKLLTSGTTQVTAGTVNSGNDVSQVMGSAMGYLGTNESRKVTLVITAAHSLEGLLQDVQLARQRYNDYLNMPPVLYTAYTCLGNTAEINPPTATVFDFYADPQLTNFISSGESLITPVVTAPQTYYVVNRDSAFSSDVYRVIASPKLVNADFLISSAPLLLDETGNTKAAFYDKSIDAVAWQWDFGNGFYGEKENPFINYPRTGTYSIALTAENNIGCRETVTKTLEVANRSNLPDITSQKICKNEEVTLSASNASNLKVYTDASLSNLIFSGPSFITTGITSDTTLYVTSMDSTYESNPKNVFIATSKVKAHFNYQPDTLDQGKKKLRLTNRSQDEELYSWYINDAFHGGNNDLVFDYSNLTSFKAMLVAEDIDGCFDSIRQTIVPSASAQPIAEDLLTCVGESVRIDPIQGSLFYFYSDVALQNLQYKGKSIQLENITSDTTVYITGIDNLLESTPETVSVQVGKPRAAFTANSDGENIYIQNSSTAASAYLWLLNTDTVSTDKDPLLPIANAGTFSIELIATDTIGCQNMFYQNVEVAVVTGTEPASTKEWQIFPNPATTQLFFTYNDVRAELLSANGKTLGVKLTNDNFIDIAPLPSGMYWVKIYAEGRVVYRKLIKE